MSLYYLVQLFHGLWFANERGVTYSNFESLKSILVSKDGSLKMHDFSQGPDGGTPQRGRLEKIVHSCLLAVRGHQDESPKELVKLQEDIKSGVGLKDLVVYWSRQLKVLLDQDGGALMVEIMLDFVKTGRRQALWRFM